MRHEGRKPPNTGLYSWEQANRVLALGWRSTSLESGSPYYLEPEKLVCAHYIELFSCPKFPVSPDLFSLRATVFSSRFS